MNVIDDFFRINREIFDVDNKSEIAEYSIGWRIFLEFFYPFKN
jgi:hypothetical protein